MTGKNQDRIVGFVLKGFPRLSETFITNEIYLLEQLGYRIHIFAMRNPGESNLHENVKKIKAGVTYIPDYFWPHFGEFMRASLGQFLKKPLVFAGAFRHALQTGIRTRSMQPLKRFVQGAYLVHYHLARQNAASFTAANGRNGSANGAFSGRIAIAHFHAHFSHDPTTMTQYAAWLAGIPYSISAHAKDIYAQEERQLLDKIARARFVVTCTGFNQRYLENLNGSTTPIFKCYHGIDLTRFATPERFSHETRPRILSIGRFVPKKGFPVLLEALHDLKNAGLRFQCHLIGGGPQENHLRQLVRQYGLQDDVEILPALSQNELLAYYQKATVFALACEVQEDGDRDGIPNVMVEAMAMGVPVVSTEISGIPELITNRENGMLVPQRNPAALAEALRDVLTLPDFAQALAEAGRKSVEQEFDAFKNIRRVGFLLSQALDGKDKTAIALAPAETTEESVLAA